MSTLLLVRVVAIVPRAAQLEREAHCQQAPGTQTMASAPTMTTNRFDRTEQWLVAQTHVLLHAPRTLATARQSIAVGVPRFDAGPRVCVVAIGLRTVVAA
jgi:hypothetical protein